MFLNTLQNTIINGGFDFWQRGSSFTSVADATYTADRWRYRKSGSMVQDVSKSVVSTSDPVLNGLNLTTTAGSSVGTGSELATNSGFDSTILGWTASGGTISWSAGNMALASGTTYFEVYQDVSGLTVGQTYVIEAQITKSETSRAAGLKVYTSGGATLISQSSQTTPATFTATLVFTATGTSHRIALYYDRNAAMSLVSDYISLKVSGASKTADLCYIQQPIEGNIIKHLLGKKVALSFWVKSSKVGTYCVRVANDLNTLCYVSEYSILVADTWEKKTIHLSLDYSTGGVWLTDTSASLYLSFVMSAGSTYNFAAPNSWFSGSAFATGNQANLFDRVGSTFNLANVILTADNEGQKRSPVFLRAGRDYAEELRLCQRYYEKSYLPAVTPGTNTIAGMMWVESSTTSNKHFYMAFASEKRVVPTMSTWDRAGNASKLTNTNNVTYTDNITNSPGGTVANMSGTRGLSWVVAAQTTPTHNTGFHWVADAELA